jgi:hypothetical protein
MPDNVHRMRRIVVVLAGVAALAGCGGGGDGGGDGDGTPERGAAYDAAFDICAEGVQATADIYGVAATEEAVVEIVVEQVSGGSVQEEESARQGCLDALEQADTG